MADQVIKTLIITNAINFHHIADWMNVQYPAGKATGYQYSSSGVRCFAKYGVENISDKISPRISQFHNITIKGSGYDFDPDVGGNELRLYITISPDHVYYEDFTAKGSHHISWDLNPWTGDPWEKGEIDALTIHFDLLIPVGSSPKFAYLDYLRLEVTYTPVIPEVTTQEPTNIEDITAQGNGTITDWGGEVTERGFEYGLTETPTWEVHETGEYGDGAFDLMLTGLVKNTTYYVRAYAKNSAGTGYGEWIEFKSITLYTSTNGGGGGGGDCKEWVKFITAAVGVIPTGTRKVICSDYTGYTYRTQASETDDGEKYVAYFVISTDLTNKQGLAYYKCILDLHLYFKNEISGIVTVEVRRDSEPAWQEVGEVTLTGLEEILVKHLATDINAKHFLFKLSAENKFKFLGMLTESIKGGL